MKVPWRLALEAALLAVVAVQGWMLWGRGPGPGPAGNLPLPPGYTPGSFVAEPLPDLPGQGLATVRATVLPARQPIGLDVPLVMPWGAVLAPSGGGQPQGPAVAWPTPEDLHGACTVNLARGDGIVGAEAWWTGCLKLPGGEDLCRGPVLADRDQVTLQVAKRELPKRWAAEARLMASFPDPGLAAGVSVYGRGRLGWTVGLERVRLDGGTWDNRGSAGLAVRLGRR